MCGIAGIIKKPQTHLELGRIASILKVLQHRGPDDAGYLLYSHAGIQVGRKWSGCNQDPDVVLLHRRLSILDLTPTGWQPMSAEDGRYFVVYNGEIYNYIELREELEGLGYQFKSHSDTEVLLAAYTKWGPAALSRLVGMFAFALLDTKQRTVLLARDCFGIKPLYYTRGDGGLAFASEVKTLLEFVPVKRRVASEELYLYLRYGVTDQGPQTLFAEVQQLAPANYVEISLDDPLRVEPICYWQPSVDCNLEISFEEAAMRLRELFLKSVRLHLRSDVPLGAALSGGIDSSSIVMAMRHLDTGADIHTFSYIAATPSLSEETWIDVVNKASGARAHKVYARPDELSEHLQRLTYCQDEPFGSTSIYAQYRVFQEAGRAGIKVMLDGQGADEILGGYRVYLAARLASLIRQNRWQEASYFLRRCAHLPGAGAGWMVQKTADYLLPGRLQIPLRKLVRKDLMPAWLDDAWFRLNGVAVRALPHPSGPDVLKQEMLHDLTANSLPHLLRYEDRNSMAFSIESRVPFLTPELVNFLFSLPEEYIIARDGTSKAVFRQAMRGLVPECVLDRRDKVGFATPEFKWLRTLDAWAQGVIGGEVAAHIPALNQNSVLQEWNETVQGRRPFDFRLWRILNVICWTQQFGAEYS